MEIDGPSTKVAVGEGRHTGKEGEGEAMLRGETALSVGAKERK